MKRVLLLGGGAAVVLAGTLVTAPTAQAAPVATTVTADCTCRSIQISSFPPYGPLFVSGTGCTGPAPAPAEGTITAGGAVYLCYSYAPPSGGSVTGFDCRAVA